ncbi:MAG: amidohydrolase family protein [Pseudomonadota bacterium]
MNRAFLWTLFLMLATAAPAYAEVVAVVGGTVHTLSDQGTLQNATVLIEDGEILSVQKGRVVPDGATVVEAQGKVVTPGIFAAHSALGLVEVSAEDSTVDSSQRGDQFGAAFDIADAYNPASTLIDINRADGVTRAVVLPNRAWPDDGMPGGGVISGQAAVVHLGDSDDFLVARGIAMVAHLGQSGAAASTGSRAAALLRLTTALQDAIDYANFSDAYDAGARREYSIGREDLEALQGVTRGDVPVYLSVDRASDIRVAIDLADRFGLRVIVVGGAEAWQVADRLAASNIAVIISPAENLPGSFDSLSSTMENARVLQDAGVRLVIADGDTHNLRNLTQLAGNAVAQGLPWIEGLRAITSTPAEILGLGDRFGSLASGMAADIVVWDGDPLEVTSFADVVFINGVRVSLENRQTLLRDRYLNLQDQRTPAYR